MQHNKTIDVHAHILSEETMRLMSKEAPSIALKRTPIDHDFSVLEFAGAVYKPFPRGAWDMEQRLRDMDAAGVGMQVLSNTPQTFLYAIDASLNAALAALQNDQIAKTIAAHPDRFFGIATLPMQAPEKAAGELERAMTRLGLAGAQIGSNVNGKNLDDPALEPLWAVAHERSAFIMVHPTQVAGAERLKSYYLANLIGNPLDTTIAAAALVFGGDVEGREDQQEDKHVIHRQRLLDQIAGEKLQRLLVGDLRARRAIQIPPQTSVEDERQAEPGQ